ncbi:hypothetical protein E4N71_06785 [Treponema vincentii]|uniref:hypothetical protein n=1 Tax=Treponema vincentii TaxID=69710 RepID=UPI0005710DC7|nr:hypothetical protein [Treponema vincentii]
MQLLRALAYSGREHSIRTAKNFVLLQIPECIRQALKSGELPLPILKGNRQLPEPKRRSVP